MTTPPLAPLWDRFVTADETTGWRPSDPAPLPTPYRDAVADYLHRVETGAPTGRARLRTLHPDPPCHTGGAGPLSACPCLETP